MNRIKELENEYKNIINNNSLKNKSLKEIKDLIKKTHNREEENKIKKEVLYFLFGYKERKGDNVIDLSKLDLEGITIDLSYIKADYINNSEQFADEIVNNFQVAREIFNEFQTSGENKILKKELKKYSKHVRLTESGFTHLRPEVVDFYKE